MPNWVLAPAPFARSLHFSERFGALYVNNPKVACSTIKLTMQRAELDDPSYTPATSVHDHEASPLTTVPDIDPDNLLDRAAFVFSFVRNPFDRLVSAYLNKIVVPQKGGKLRQQVGFDAEYCPTFAEFIEAVCAQTPQDMNPHWRPQVLNLSVDRISYDFIGKLEAFEADWSVVAQRTGLPAVVSDSGAKTRLWQKERPEYDAESVARVLKSFAADFEFFGFEEAGAAAY